jgi:hypothetical protein
LLSVPPFKHRTVGHSANITIQSFFFFVFQFIEGLWYMDEQRQFPGYFSYIVKSILFVRKTGMPGETQGSAASH